MARRYGSSNRIATITAQNAITHEYNTIKRKRRTLKGKATRTMGERPTVTLPRLAQPTRDAVNERIADYRRALRLCERNQCECLCRTCHAGNAPCTHECKHYTCIATFARIARDNNYAPFSFMHGICFERLPKTTEGVLANYVEHNARMLARLQSQFNGAR